MDHHGSPAGPAPPARPNKNKEQLFFFLNQFWVGWGGGAGGGGGGGCVLRSTAHCTAVQIKPPVGIQVLC